MANKLKLWLTKQLMWRERRRLAKFFFEQDEWPEHLSRQRWIDEQLAKGLPVDGERGVCTEETAEAFKVHLEEMAKRGE